MCRSIILSKIAHQTWYNCPFSQRNKTTERAVGVGVGGCREVRGGGGDGPNFKKREYTLWGGLCKVGG